MGKLRLRLKRDLKFVASTWIDNGYRTMDAKAAFQDYFGTDDSTPLSIDSIKVKKAILILILVCSTPTENFRIGIHFQQPFIDFYWEFFFNNFKKKSKYQKMKKILSLIFISVLIGQNSLRPFDRRANP